MIALLTRRLAALAVVLVVTSFVVFAGLYLAPGSPESFLLAGKTVSPETVASIRAQYHLDDPFLVRYGDWLAGAASGDFGRSLTFRQDVGGLVTARVPTTLLLAGYAALLIVVGGVALGVLSALRRGALDAGVLVGTSVAAGTPSFVAAVVLITVFAVELGWFPAFGAGEGLSGRLEHLTLPAFALALPYLALVARVTRSAMIDELGREHVETARSRGLPERHVLWRHVLRNALIPITTVSGLVVAGLISGTVVVENAFGLNGVGSLLLEAVNVKDFPVVQAVVLILVAAFVITNTLVDVLYALIDPRVGLARRGA